MLPVLLMAIMTMTAASFNTRLQVNAFKVSTSSTNSGNTGMNRPSHRRYLPKPKVPSRTHPLSPPQPPRSSVGTSTTGSTTILSVATGGAGGGEVSNPILNRNVLGIEWTRDRVQRSMMASLGCMVTWLLANTSRNTGSSLLAMIPPLTIVQASCTTGLLSCLLFTTPFFFRLPTYSVATFCGALAGMSGNVLQYTASTALSSSASALVPLLFMSSSVGLAFGLWDDRKWGVGKGGRLGTIAFGGNIFYTLSSFLYHKFLRYNGNAIKLFTLVPLKTQQIYASMPIFTSLVLSTLLLRSSRQKSSSSATDAQQQQSIYKALLFCTMAIPMFMNGSKGLTSTITEYMATVVSIFIGSQLVHRNIGKYGPILPTSVVGMIGSILFAGSGHWGITSPKIFLGALMGLTTIPTFGVVSFLQSSFLSAVLFHLGILDGFGGKLGCLAYIGVLFGM
jgi:hypothetical protein